LDFSAICVSIVGPWNCLGEISKFTFGLQRMLYTPKYGNRLISFIPKVIQNAELYNKKQQFYAENSNFF
jgi:hypothetical protein